MKKNRWLSSWTSSIGGRGGVGSSTSSRARSGQSSNESDDEDSISEEPTFDREPPLYLLYPSASRPGSQAPKTTLVSGKFRLKIKKEQHVLAVVAKLVPSYLFKLGDTVERGARPPLTCQLVETERRFEIGDIELPFAFEIPCDHWGRSSITDDTACGPLLPDNEPIFSAWYSFEVHIMRLSPSPLNNNIALSTSSPSMRVGQSTEAGSTPEYRALDADITHKTNPASLPTVKFGPPELLVIPIPSKHEFEILMGDSEAWRERYHSKFFALVVSPVEPGELPAPLEATIEEFAPQLGPISIILTSRSLAIGALLTFSLQLPAIPGNCTLKHIRGFVEQVTCWRSLQGKDKAAPDIDFPHRREFFNLEGKDFVLEGMKRAISPVGNKRTRDSENVSSATSSLSASTSASLPNDRCLNPSTAPETKCPMICKHAIIIELEVIDGNGKTKIVKLRHPIHLASCMLISELLKLPRYDSQPIPKSEFQPQRPDEKYSCVCGFTLDQLIQRENEGLVPAMLYEPPPIKAL